MRAGSIAMATALMAGLVLLAPPAAQAVGGEGEAWPAFTESSACGAQRVSTPHNDHTGWLNVADHLRGDFGAFFGRTVDDVFDNLVPWTVPGSNETLFVHPFAVPALEDAATRMQESLAAGQVYRIDDSGTFATAARTIGGSIRISRHTYGIAMDVNAARNPYRGDNVLVTDLPDWWTQALLDAGFCWGGLWVGSKDTMHFAWQGPAFSEYSEIPPVYEPVTDPKVTTFPDVAVQVVPEAPTETIRTVLADATSNGAVDIIRIAHHGQDVIVDVSTASRRHNACSSRTSLVADLEDIAADALEMGFGDWDGRGGNDLWMVTGEGGSLRLTVRWAFGGYAAETSAMTGVPTPSPDAWISTADFDVDGSLDLIVIDGAEAAVWSVDPWSGTTALLDAFPAPFPGASQYFIADHDLDLAPDLWAIVSGSVKVALAADDHLWIGIEESPIGIGTRIEDVVASDYDGDGTPDIISFDGRTKRVWLRNTAIPDGLPAEVWFEAEEPDCADGEPTWVRDELQFSTSGWVAEGSHGWRVLHGLPAGCDPEDEGCTIETATRQDFAEFLAWIDGLAPASSNETIAAARALDIAGYRLPCVIDDEECWEAPMLRTELAAYFGIFMADRRGDVPNPHRWVIPAHVGTDGPAFR